MKHEMPRFDDRMSDAEALMWRAEKDPFLTSTFANITILDRAPNFDAFVARMDRASRIIPRLRQRGSHLIGTKVLVAILPVDQRSH